MCEAQENQNNLLTRLDTLISIISAVLQLNDQRFETATQANSPEQQTLHCLACESEQSQVLLLLQRRKFGQKILLNYSLHI